MEHDRMTGNDEDDKPPSTDTRKAYPITLDWDVHSLAWKPLLGDLKPLAQKAAEITIQKVMKHQPYPIAISFALGDDALLQALNRKYRHKDKPTNVLSFQQVEDFSNLESPYGAPIELGDIIISHDTISREADSQGKSLLHHTVHMIVHGLLHLLGFDHMSDAEADEMEAFEIQILNQIDINNPYMKQMET